MSETTNVSTPAIAVFRTDIPPACESCESASPIFTMASWTAFFIWFQEPVTSFAVALATPAIFSVASIRTCARAAAPSAPSPKSANAFVTSLLEAPSMSIAFARSFMFNPAAWSVRAILPGIVHALEARSHSVETISRCYRGVGDRLKQGRHGLEVDAEECELLLCLFERRDADTQRIRECRNAFHRIGGASCVLRDCG